MKKSLFFAAMACIAFAGCTEDEVFNTDLNQERAIAFSAPVVKPNTRAASEVGNVYDETLRFRVWGHYFTDEYNGFGNGEVYINEAECENEGTTWIPKKDGKTYYWPKNGTLTFIAYHPSTQNLVDKTSVDASGLTIAGYTVDNTKPNTDMEDLMFSERAYDMKKSSLDGDAADPYTGVDLQFRHALSSIVFNAKLNKEYPGTTVIIKGISLSNVKSQGTFKQNLNDVKGATTKTERLPGNSTNKAAWAFGDPATTAKYTVDLTPVALSTSVFWPCTNSNTEPALAEFRATDLMLIPQEVNNVTLRIDYSIQTMDSEPIDQHYETKLSGNWNIGYRYIYNVLFSFDPITFAPAVDVWQTVSDLNVGNDYMND